MQLAAQHMALCETTQRMFNTQRMLHMKPHSRVYDLCNFIKFSKYLLFVDDITIFWAISLLMTALYFKWTLDSIHGWCKASHTKVSISKTKVISCNRKTNMIPIEYELCGYHLNHIDTFKALGIILDIKLSFHHCVAHVVS